jgi:hypothetical protein
MLRIKRKERRIKERIKILTEKEMKKKRRRIKFVHGTPHLFSYSTNMQEVKASPPSSKSLWNIKGHACKFWQAFIRVAKGNDKNKASKHQQVTWSNALSFFLK